MPKRAATTELNHLNWNQEEENEEECTQKIASPEVMSKRVIKTGKRRIANSSGSGTIKSAFTDFIGFGGTMNNTSCSDGKSAFTFLVNSNTSLLNNTNGVPPQKTDNTGTEESSDNNLDMNNEYLSKLKCLNETVLEWIKIHVGKNPTCILTPVFNDYEKYLKEIQFEKHQNKQDDKKVLTEFPTSSNLPSLPAKTSFSSNFFSPNQEIPKESAKLLSQSVESSTNPVPGLGPLPATLNCKGASKSIFGSTLLGTGNSPIIENKKLSSGIENGPLFSTGNITMQETSEKEEDEPPKNVFEPVTEKEAVFSQRVKLFFKKKDNFVDNGIGTLYIKPADEEGTKYQAVVRADTNLGNILLNTILNESLPTTKVGKNNVMIVCILQVDKELKSVPVLLRVKTEEDAVNLLEQINKYKK